MLEHYTYNVFGGFTLVNQLEQEKIPGKGGRMAEQLSRYDCVILDELGSLPSLTGRGRRNGI